VTYVTRLKVPRGSQPVLTEPSESEFVRLVRTGWSRAYPGQLAVNDLIRVALISSRAEFQPGLNSTWRQHYRLNMLPKGAVRVHFSFTTSDLFNGHTFHPPAAVSEKKNVANG
jgi:hypothetical protein